MTRLADLRLLLLLVTWIIVADSFRDAAAQSPITRESCDTPKSCIETLHRGLVQLSRQQDSGNLEERYVNLKPLITTTHDLPYIARFAVRRQWADFSAEEQEVFVQTFERLSVMTYASRFVRLSDDTFRILEVIDPEDERAQVVGRIARDAQPDIPIEYLLQHGENGWRIVNVIADGVSDLALKRAEYQRILADGSAADLIAYLEQQTVNLR